MFIIFDNIVYVPNGAEKFCDSCVCIQYHLTQKHQIWHDNRSRWAKVFTITPTRVFWWDYPVIFEDMHSPNAVWSMRVVFSVLHK